MTPTPTLIVAYLALFAVVGFLTIFVALLLGRLLRPSSPSRVKGESYECGEPAVGSSFVQFDLRFYVIALLFIIFDVEVAFFFPWATVFGKATQLMDPNLEKATIVATAELNPGEQSVPRTVLTPAVSRKLGELGIEDAGTLDALTPEEATDLIEQDARKLALCSIADIGVFFFVLLVGFAYVWKQGDLNWVRATQDRYASRDGPPGSSE